MVGWRRQNGHDRASEVQMGCAGEGMGGLCRGGGLDEQLRIVQMYGLYAE